MILAVGSRNRTAMLPNVPTTLEAGYPESDFNFYVGLFAPANTPRQIVDLLHDETTKALHAQFLQEKLSKIGAEPIFMSQAEFDASLKAEFASNAGLVKAIGLQPT